MQFRSKSQQRWAFATKQAFAKKAGKATKKSKGGFGKLGQYVPGSKSPNKKRRPGKKIPVNSPAYKRALKRATERAQAIFTRESNALTALRERGLEPTIMRVVTEFPMREAKFNADGSIDSLVIREGDGNPHDNNYYTSSFVESLKDLVNGADAFFNHPSAAQERDLPERDVRDKAGYWGDYHVKETKDEHGRTVAGGWAKFFPRVGDAQLASLIRTTQEKMRKYPEKPPFVAFSINGYGAGAPGKSPRDGSDKNLVETATALRSVDLVTYAGAGGRPTFQESDSMKIRGANKQNVGGKQPTTFREALDNGLQGEIDATAALAADVATATRTAILSGPQGAAIMEAAGIPKGTKVEALTEAQEEAVDKHLGLDSDKFTDAIVATVGPDGEESEEEEQPAQDERDGEDGRVQTLTKEQIEAMTPEQLKAELAKRADPVKLAGAATESLRSKLTEAERAREAADRGLYIDKCFETLKFPAGPHRDLARTMVESMSDPNKVLQTLRNYREANLVANARGAKSGATGDIRESSGEGGGLRRLDTGIARR